MHNARAEHQSQGWVAVCSSCEWMGSDYRSPGPAAQEAKMHRHQQRPAWSLEKIVPWSPTNAPYRPKS